GAPTGSLESVSEVVLSSGSGYAVYEVLDSNTTFQESAQFPTFIVMPRQSAAAIAHETVALAPVSSVLTASQTAPVPRFGAVPVTSDCNAIGDCAAAYFPRLMVDSSPIVISAIEKGGLMTSPAAYIPIRNGGGGRLAWTVTIDYLDGSGWLVPDN